MQSTPANEDVARLVTVGSAAASDEPLSLARTPGGADPRASTPTLVASLSQASYAMAASMALVPLIIIVLLLAPYWLTLPLLPESRQRTAMRCLVHLRGWATGTLARVRH